jgi:uridine phosphorylase
VSPIHLRPSAPIAPDALLPGDPARALALAQQLMEQPKMANHSRGLWGYSGETTAGQPLTIQATGVGGPSAAIVFTELAELGVEKAIRVGTCGALTSELSLGDLIVATSSIASDGTSVRLGAEGEAQPDAALTAALESAGARPAKIATTDLFYEHDSALERSWVDAGALAVEMEAATLFALGAKNGVAVACALVVTDLLALEGDGVRQRIDDEALAGAVERMGEVALAALGTTRSGPGVPGSAAGR